MKQGLFTAVVLSVLAGATTVCDFQPTGSSGNSRGAVVFSPGDFGATAFSVELVDRISEIEYSFSAEVYTIDDPGNQLKNGIIPGDTMTGIVRYTSGAGNESANPQFGNHHHRSGAYGLYARINGLVFCTDTTAPDVEVLIDNEAYRFAVSSYNNFPGNTSGQINEMVFELQAEAGFEDARLPYSLLPLSSLESGTFNIRAEAFSISAGIITLKRS